MSDFINKLNSLTRTPEQVNSDKDKEYREQYKSSLRVCAEELIKRIKEDITQKASNGKYKIVDGRKFICGTVGVGLDTEHYIHYREFSFIHNFYNKSTKSIKDLHYLSYFISSQNMKYKTGQGFFRSSREIARTDKFMITPLAKELIAEVKTNALNDKISVCGGFVVDTIKEGKVIKSDFFNNEEIVVNEGFSESKSVKGCIYYEIIY